MTKVNHEFSEEFFKELDKFQDKIKDKFVARIVYKDTVLIVINEELSAQESSYIPNGVLIFDMSEERSYWV